MRCTARASPVGGVRRRANAFSLCGLSLHAGCPPLLRDTAQHSVSPLHVELNMSGAHDIPLRLRDEFSSTRYERRARHSISIARQFSSTHYEPARTAWQRFAHAASCSRQLLQLQSLHWPLRARHPHSRGAYLFFASMSAIDHDGARTTAVNLGHPFVVGIVRFERCAQCFVLLVGGFVFDFHIDQTTHR